jgi:arylsulfatase A-like enzyme
LLLSILFAVPLTTSAADRPNILFAFADDWGRQAGAYGDPVVKTPNFDRIAREGVLFQHAYISSPSCTPSRGAVLTGRYHWELKGAANLWSVFPDEFTTYPEILTDNGYFTGVSGKGWGPGRTATKGRPVAGKRFGNFQQFLKARPDNAPFCYWLGTSDPHRPFKAGSGKAAGMDLSKIDVPACFPDSETVRSDIADYYVEVQRFDALVGSALSSLEEAGELDNTIIVMSSDHGMPFPRCKSNLYDTGAQVPLAIRFGSKIKTAGRSVQDFVSLIDLAPTFLQVAGIDVPATMSGRSLWPILESNKSGIIEVDRGSVIFGKERHVPSQEKPDMGGYPGRAIRSHEFLLIRNYRPDRWPNGTPDYRNAAIAGTWLGDTDNGPTKTYMVDNRDKDETHRRLYDLSFAKRPAIELYDLKSDPDQLNNVADKPQYADAIARLSRQLDAKLKASGDPRADGKGDFFDTFPYLGGGPKFPGFGRK